MTNIEPHVIRAAEVEMLTAARASSAVTVFAALNEENRKLAQVTRKLRDELTVATVAALAANDYYLCEFAGWKTYRRPTEIRASFADAMEAYREAMGMSGVEGVAQ